MSLSDEIRLHHGGRGICDYCNRVMPCIAVQAADELDRLQAWAVQAREALEKSINLCNWLAECDPHAMAGRAIWKADSKLALKELQPLKDVLATAPASPTAAGEEV